MTITHVCLSDLHFGAETSLLTELDENYNPAYQQVSPVLARLMACLRRVLSEQPQATRPTLVLLGDVLELALSDTHQALMTFERFLTLAFPGGADDLFNREVIYVPGNHDHHLWEIARETHYLNYLNSLPPGAPLGEEWHITRLYKSDTSETEDFPEQRLLTGMARRQPTLRDLRISTAYPNMGLRSPDGLRSVIFTHGHFIEPLYTLMSQLNCMIFRESATPDTVLELEQENFAWIDFFWSTMGRSGLAGKQVQRVYEKLASEAGREDLSKRLGAGIVERFFGNDWIPDAAQRFAFEKLFDALSRRAGAHERVHVDDPLGPDANAGLKHYISGPLLRQITHECRHTRLPESLAVIFGHTHKPFESSLEVPGFARPVEVLNTGGWVVDSVERQPLHGAAVVFVDDALHCASLRMYTENAATEPLAAIRVGSVFDNPLGHALEQAIGAAASESESFTSAVELGIRVRAGALSSRTT